jgi:hypothetical protein
MSEINKASDVTQDQIDKWKKEHGKVFKITVEDKTGFFKKPDRRTLAAAMKFGSSDPMKFNETIAKNCWLGGDEELNKDDDYFMGAATQFGEMIKMKEAEIKEL